MLRTATLFPILTLCAALAVLSAGAADAATPLPLGSLSSGFAAPASLNAGH